MGRTVCLVLIILPNVDVGPTMDGVTIRSVVVIVVQCAMRIRLWYYYLSLVFLSTYNHHHHDDDDDDECNT